jgi:hypothetical protein
MGESSQLFAVGNRYWATANEDATEHWCVCVYVRARERVK